MEGFDITQILNILQAIAKFIGVDPAILAGVAGVTLTNIVVVNLLKAYLPTVIINSRIPWVVALICLVEAVATVYRPGNPFTFKLGATIVILGFGLWASTVGSWATAKIALHKVGTPASNPSGGAKPATPLGGSSG